MIGICERLTSRVRGQNDLSRSSGDCEFGIFGTVVAKGDSPAHFQACVLSSRREFILITHTSKREPDSQELQEANEIALMTGCT